MSDPHPPLNLQRSLRRAANINSHFVEKSQDGSSKRTALGASINRTFKDLTHSKSKSPNAVPFSDDRLAITNIECSHHQSETLPDGSEFTTPQPMENIVVPELIQSGTLMTKVSLKGKKNVVLRVDADLGQIVWVSKQQKISECQITFTSPTHDLFQFL